MTTQKSPTFTSLEKLAAYAEGLLTNELTAKFSSVQITMTLVTDEPKLENLKGFEELMKLPKLTSKHLKIAAINTIKKGGYRITIIAEDPEKTPEDIVLGLAQNVTGGFEQGLLIPMFGEFDDLEEEFPPIGNIFSQGFPWEQ